MAELFLPVLSHFQNNNPWLGSMGRLRYRIIPTVAEREEESLLTAQVWEGPWAYEFSTVEETKDFPLTEEGLEALQQWLEEQRQVVEARPQHTLEENIARKKMPEAAE